MLDPTAHGVLSLGDVPRVASDDFSRTSPRFRSGDTACRHLLPADDDGDRTLTSTGLASRPAIDMATTIRDSPRPAASSQRAQATLPSLTGMRWMAALLVFGLHLRNLGYLNGAPVDIVGWPFMAGATGVSFFFILSGFVLTWSARPHDTATGFWRRRFARIYPVHLVTALAALLLGYAVLGHSRPAGPQLAANLLLIHSWWPAWWQTLNPVSWSLACEAFFYATFPALARVLRRLGHRALTALAAAAVATVVLLPWVNTHYALGLVLFSAPLARLPEFILGAVLARLVQLGHWRGPGLKASSVIALTGYILASVASADVAFAACTVLGFALLIPAAALADLRGLPSVWRHPALVRLGELSFAFYMVHILVLHAGSAVLTTLPAPVGAAAALSASLALSWLSYEGVERPARKLILPRSHRRAGSRRDHKRSACRPLTIRRDQPFHQPIHPSHGVRA